MYGVNELLNSSYLVIQYIYLDHPNSQIRLNVAKYLHTCIFCNICIVNVIVSTCQLRLLGSLLSQNLETNLTLFQITILCVFGVFYRSISYYTYTKSSLSQEHFIHQNVNFPQISSVYILAQLFESCKCKDVECKCNPIHILL